MSDFLKAVFLSDARSNLQSLLWPRRPYRLQNLSLGYIFNVISHCFSTPLGPWTSYPFYFCLGVLLLFMVPWWLITINVCTCQDKPRYTDGKNNLKISVAYNNQGLFLTLVTNRKSCWLPRSLLKWTIATHTPLSSWMLLAQEEKGPRGSQCWWNAPLRRSTFHFCSYFFVQLWLTSWKTSLPPQK